MTAKKTHVHRKWERKIERQGMREKHTILLITYKSHKTHKQTLIFELNYITNVNKKEHKNCLLFFTTEKSA